MNIPYNHIISGIFIIISLQYMYSFALDITKKHREIPQQRWKTLYKYDTMTVVEKVYDTVKVYKQVEPPQPKLTDKQIEMQNQQWWFKLCSLCFVGFFFCCIFLVAVMSGLEEIPPAHKAVHSLAVLCGLVSFCALVIGVIIKYFESY